MSNPNKMAHLLQSQSGLITHDASTPLVDAIYVHVPFCFHKCHYCDFYSVVDTPAPGSGNRQTALTDALIAELEYKSATSWMAPQDPSGNATKSQDTRSILGVEQGTIPLPDRIPSGELPPSSPKPRTIFVGGGTPTLLETHLWKKLLEAMKRTGILDRIEEFTVEANPETVTDDLLTVLVAGGVNRMSVGVQSFKPELLKALGRWHDPAHAVKAVHQIRRCGIHNLNLDLIFAIPGQSLADLDADLDAALSLEPEHLSCYNLTFEPDTAMTARMRKGRIKPAPEDLERDMYEHVMSRLHQAGFEHYEISSWARPKTMRSKLRQGDPARCVHNLAYWKNKNWLGIGPAAASHVNGRRWKNDPHLERYISSSPFPPVVDDEQLPTERSVGEQLMLSLRMTDGVAWQWLVANLATGNERWTAINQLMEIDRLERIGDRLRLTQSGLFMADSVLAQLL